MIKLVSKEGHTYVLYDDGKLFLILKKTPPSGKKERMLGTVRHGVFNAQGAIWYKKKKCWMLARFPLVKTGKLGIRIVRLMELATEQGSLFSGYMHPKLLLYRANQNKSAYQRQEYGYETQVKLLPQDIQPTEEMAVRKFEKWVERTGYQNE